jgi:ParB family transcriptional regulator, chromosome partitioning protein
VSTEKPRRLGRGLDALIPGSAAVVSSATPESDLQRIPLSRIRQNPYQPRRQFDAAELVELESSLKASGLLQPITVRRQGDAFELIAGERRMRAATNLGWTEIAAIVREFDDRTMLVLALVENLQRSNLNAIEEARGYRQLIEEFRLTQQQVAEAVGKDRTTVTNLLRVLSLPEEVQQMVEGATISAGHARALLALNDPPASLRLARETVAEGLSVRELERRVRELTKPETKSISGREQGGNAGGKATTPAARSDPGTRRIEDDLRRFLQTDVHLHVTETGAGRVEVSFYSSDDLERVLDLILKEHRKDY